MSKRNISRTTVVDDTADSVRQPTVAIRLNKQISYETTSWLIEKIVADKVDHGCQLTVTQGGSTLLLVR